jgi:hypothetical protein
MFFKKHQYHNPIMNTLSEKITELAKETLPKAKGNSCYLDMDEGKREYSSAVWLFPDGTFRSAPYTRNYVNGKINSYKEHTMVYKEIFEPIHDYFRYKWEEGDKPIYPETSADINSEFRDYTNSIRVRCSQSKRDDRKELLVELNIDNNPTEKQFRAIRRELCKFDYDLFYYDITDATEKDNLWVRTFGGTVMPTCNSVFREMKKDFDYWANKKDKTNK